MKLRFEASLDRTTKWMTFACIVIMVFPVATVFLSEVPKLLGAGIALLLLVVLAACFVYAPRYYEVTDDSVNIVRLADTVKIPILSLREVRAVAPQELKWTLRTFGVGGLFGYFGSFTNRNFGMMDWYLTNRKSVVLLRTEARKIMVSPDEAPDFVAAVNLRRKI